MIAILLTPWQEKTSGGETVRKPLLAAWLLASGFTHPTHPWQICDVTAQPAANIMPNPNLLAVEIKCDSATLAAIEADPQFNLLWSDSKKGTVTKPSLEFQALKDYLASQGFTAEGISTAIGASVSGRSREEIGKALITKLRSLPKSQA
jgi:hypothetical protein